MPEKQTPLTDAWITRIAARLSRRGARSAAARYAGISRQNLGKILRERGASRDSEVLLRLEEFAGRQDGEGSSAHEPKPKRATGFPPVPVPVAGEGEEERLPSWLL